MEARLFFISIWCGVYGQILRTVYRREEWLEKTWVTVLLNSLFWATGAAMLGMLVASYTEKMEETTTYSLLFAAGGLVLGALTAVRQAKEMNTRDHLLKDNLEWADTGFSAILLAAFVMFFVVQAFKIPSGSMRMTFVEGDHLFVNKFIYGIPIPFTNKKVVPFRDVQIEDIVIFRFPAHDKESPHYGKDFIKRVVALEGQQLQIKDKNVFVDGVEQKGAFQQRVDPVIYPPFSWSPDQFQEKWESGFFSMLAGNDIRDNFGPVVVPKGHVFVMGDNRDRSFDSRFWGPLKVEAIKGKAWLRYWGPSVNTVQDNWFKRHWPFTRFGIVH